MLEKEWKDGAYGKKVEKAAAELFNNPPVAITACYLTPDKYLHKYKKRRKQ